MNMITLQGIFMIIIFHFLERENLAQFHAKVCISFQQRIYCSIVNGISNPIGKEALNERSIQDINDCVGI